MGEGGGERGGKDDIGKETMLLHVLCASKKEHLVRT